MKRIYQLQNLLEIVIWGSVILMTVLVLASVYAMITGDFSNINFKFHEEKLEQLQAYQIMLMVLFGIGYVLFFVALFKLKHLISNFVKRLFFTEKTVRLTKQIGKLILLSSLLFYVPKYFYMLILNNKIAIGFEAISPESFFFLLIMGLFFLTLGHIFQEAKNLKEENELTV